MIPLTSLGGHDKALIASESAVPRLCDLNRPSAVLGGAEWVIACQIDGLASVTELARRSGIAVHDAMERVTRLARAGLCAITEAAAGGTGDPQPPPGAAALLPRRVRETGRAAGSPPARPDPGLLQQLLNGLNSLE